MFSILTVDDCEETLVFQELALSRAGYNVVTSNCAADALEKIGGLPRIDLILLDVQMGAVSGPELLEMIKAKYPVIYAKVPVVFVTASSEPPPVKVAGWIPKMTDLDEFVARVGKFLGPNQGVDYAR